MSYVRQDGNVLSKSGVNDVINKTWALIHMIQGLGEDECLTSG